MSVETAAFIFGGTQAACCFLALLLARAAKLGDDMGRKGPRSMR